VKLEGGPSAGLTRDLDLQPTDAVADARSQGLGSGLFGGKPRGKALRGLALAQAIGLLRRRVHAVEKALPKAIHGLLDTPDLCQVDSGADNHASLKLHRKPLQLPAQAIQSLLPAVLSQSRSCAVRLRHNLHAAFDASDKASVRLIVQTLNAERTMSTPWAMQMNAISLEEPSRLVQTLTGAILGCGGWVLSRGSNNSGTISMLFEFERQVCVEIYSVMIAAGLELSQSGHIRFTELCQCTRSHMQDCDTEIASVDLEIQTFPVEMMHGVRAQGIA
jgi:hypothetical protein